MFWTRFLSSIVLTISALVLLSLGGNYLFATVLILSLIGLMELYRVLKINKTFCGILGYIAAITYFILLYFHLLQYQMMLFIVFLMSLMFAYVISFPKYSTEQIAVAFLGLFYVCIMLAYIYQVRMFENGNIMVWMIFIGAWGSDTFAYLVGMLIGKHKFAPKLSPKKSIEGCLGGVAGAAFLGMIFAMIVRKYLVGIQNPLLVFAIIGAVSSIISQIGDLAASAIKRNHEIKDYGTLIPGHGGVLDRFDSIIFTAPIVYYLVVLFQ